MGFSHGYGKVPSENYAIDAIRVAYDFGCIFFDTEETYGREQFFPGHNEQLLGKAIEPFRNNVVVATKLHISSEEYFEEKNLYNILERDCEKDVLPYCGEQGIGVVPFSPIASGFLSGKVTVDTKFEGDDVRKFVPQLQRDNLIANQPILDIINRYADDKNATNAQISLAWMLKKYPNIVPIPGSKNRERILENLGAWNIELTNDEFNSLEKALSDVKIYGHRGHEESQQKSFSHNWRTNA